MILQGQNLIWTFAALAWAWVMDTPWEALSWVIVVPALLRVMYLGLCSAVENYCDLAEATVHYTGTVSIRRSGCPFRKTQRLR